METYTRKDERGIWRLPETQHNLIALMKGIEFKLGIMLAVDAILTYILVLVNFYPIRLVNLYAMYRFGRVIYELLYHDDAFTTLYFRDSTYLLLATVVKMIYVRAFAHLRSLGWSAVGMLGMLPVLACAVGSILFVVVERPLHSVTRCYKFSRSLFATTSVSCSAIEPKYVRWLTYIGLVSSGCTSLVSIIIAVLVQLIRPGLYCFSQTIILLEKLMPQPVGTGHRRFVYAPIVQPSGIRLVILERRWPFQPVKLKLYESSLDDEPDYEAISYCWGKDHGSRTILVNDCAMRVPEATFQVLKTRSSLFRTRHFWIDAVCINQEDVMEKSLQVQQMTRIYASAWRVLIFLEGSTWDAFMAFSILQELFGFVRDEQLSGQQISNNCLFERFGLRWQSLDRILNQAYFSRIWVIQEIARAKSIDAICGGLYFDFDVLKDMAKLITLEPVLVTLLKSAPMGFKSHTSLQNIEFMVGIGASLKVLPKVQLAKQMAVLLGEAYYESIIEQMDSNELQMIERLEFSSLLRVCTKFGATDDRDRLFAFYGLAKNYPSWKEDRLEGQDGAFEEYLRRSQSNSAGQWVNIDLTPDYRRGVQELYIDVTRYFLEGEDPFVGFARAGISQRSEQKEMQQLPTWVTDWSFDTLRPMFDPSFFTLPYRAGGETKARIRVGEEEEGGLICHVYSKSASTVQQLGMAFPRLEWENDDEYYTRNGLFTFPETMLKMMDWHDEALEIARKFGNASRSLPAQHHGATNQDELLIEAFWRTIIGNKSLLGQAPAEFARDYRDWVKLMNEGRQHTEASRRRQSWFQSEAAAAMPSEQRLTTERFAVRLQAVHAFSTALNLMVLDRRFCVFDDGRMGVVPNDAKIGDEAHVFAGSRIPVLLRRVLNMTEEFFQVVGECYVGGIMDGQLYEDDSMQAREIRLI